MVRKQYLKKPSNIFRRLGFLIKGSDLHPGFSVLMSTLSSVFPVFQTHSFSPPQIPTRYCLQTLNVTTQWQIETILQTSLLSHSWPLL